MLLLILKSLYCSYSLKPNFFINSLAGVLHHSVQVSGTKPSSWIHLHMCCKTREANPFLRYFFITCRWAGCPKGYCMHQAMGVSWSSKMKTPTVWNLLINDLKWFLLAFRFSECVQHCDTVSVWCSSNFLITNPSGHSLWGFKKVIIQCAWHILVGA